MYVETDFWNWRIALILELKTDKVYVFTLFWIQINYVFNASGIIMQSLKSIEQF